MYKVTFEQLFWTKSSIYSPRSEKTTFQVFLAVILKWHGQSLKKKVDITYANFGSAFVLSQWQFEQHYVPVYNKRFNPFTHKAIDGVF